MMPAKRAAIERLAVKYAPDDNVDNRARAIEREWKPLCMLEMVIEHMSGKQAVKLARQAAEGGRRPLGNTAFAAEGKLQRLRPARVGPRWGRVAGVFYSVLQRQNTTSVEHWLFKLRDNAAI